MWRILVAFVLGGASLFLALFAQESSVLYIGVLLALAAVSFLYGAILWRSWARRRARLPPFPAINPFGAVPSARSAARVSAASRCPP